MRLFSSRTGLLASLALTFLPIVTAVYEDEAYKTDFGYELVGLPIAQNTFFHRPRQNEKASLLYTLSDAGVVAAVNPGTGDIVWRQLLQDPLLSERQWTGGSLKANGNDVITAAGGKITAWDALRGRVRWSSHFDGEARDVHVSQASDSKSTQQGNILALFADIATGAAVARKLTSDTGALVWQHQSDIGDIPLKLVSTQDSVWMVVLNQADGGTYSIKLISLDVSTGVRKQSHTLPSSVSSLQDILFVGIYSNVPIIVWTESGAVKAMIGEKATIRHLDITTPSTSVGGEKSFHVHMSTASNELQHLLLHTQTSDSHWADVFNVDTQKATIEKTFNIPTISGSGAFSTSMIDNKVYFTRNTQLEVQIFESSSPNVLESWPVSGKQVGIVHAVSEAVRTKGNSFAVRSAVVSSNDDWTMNRNGAAAWVRPEGLTRAVAVTYAEIPEAETLAKELEAEAHSNPVSAYAHRLKRHIKDLKHFPSYLISLPQKSMAMISMSTTPPAVETVTRDSFGFAKIVILATERGMIYALDSVNGRILWSKRAYPIPEADSWSVKAIWAENEKGQVTLRGGDGEYIIVKTATGAVIEKTSPGSWPTLQSSALVDSPAGRWIMPLGINGDPGNIPIDWAPNSTIVVRGDQGQVRGLAFEKKGTQGVPYEVWSFMPKIGQTILSVTTRPQHNPVASIGHVLADRTVLYKYINPNLALIMTASVETSAVTLYLIDSSSGTLLYTTTHTSVDVTKPVTSTMSGNTFTYTLFISATSQTSTQGYHLFTSELFESSLSNDRGPLITNTNFSSILPQEEPTDEPRLPHVKTLSYLISQPVTLQTTTSTLQGISTTSLLLYLPISKSIISLPAHFLNARRPFGRPPTKAEQEEGLMPYLPVLDFDPKLMITHKREVMGIKGMITTPALIESTSLVFAYGLDVFGTRITPSGAFDVLGRDFNKASLIGTVGMLALLTAVMAPLVRKKTVKGRWGGL